MSILITPHAVPSWVSDGVSIMRILEKFDHCMLRLLLHQLLWHEPSFILVSLFQSYVEGRNCDRCQSNTFFLSEDNPLGCTACFCMGVTNQCQSALMYRAKVSLSNSQWVPWPGNWPYVSMGSGNGLALNWWQAITWSNVDTDLQCHVTSLGHNEWKWYLWNGKGK